MYNMDITNKELQYFHQKVKVTDILSTSNNSDLFHQDGGKYFPLFYFDKIADATKDMRLIGDSRCILNPDDYIHFESNPALKNITRLKRTDLIKGIGDSLSEDEYNYLIYYLRTFHPFAEDIEINKNTVTGEYGEYVFNWDSGVIVDEGILITEDTPTLGTVTLTNPIFNNSTYHLKLKIVNYDKTNICTGDDEEIIITRLEIPLTRGGPVDITFEDVEVDNIVSFDATVEVRHDLPVIKRNKLMYLTASSGTVYVGANVLLTATYVDEYNIPIEDATVTFKNGATTLGTAVTNSNGVAVYTWETSTSGSASLTAVCSTVVSEAVSVSVVNPPSPSSVGLSCDKEYIVKNKSVSLTAIVKDSNNTPIPNQTVTFKVGGTSIDTAPTNAIGIASITYTPTSAGTVSLTATAGSVTSSSVSLRVKNNNTTNSVTLTAQPNPALVDVAVKVTATALDSDNDPVPNRNVYMNGGLLGVTGDDGKFEQTLTFSSTGTYPMSMSIDNKNGSVNIVVIEPSPVPIVSYVSLVSDKASCTLGDNVGLTATVLDQNDAPMSGETVTFKLNGNSIGTGVTDSNGEASLSYTTQIAGTNNFTSSCSDVASSTVNVTVNKKTASLFLSADSSTIAVGENLVLRGVLNIEGNQSVKIYQGNTVIDTVTTYNKAFSKTVSGLSVGSYSFKAGFDGNSSYESVVSIVVNVTVVNVLVPGSVDLISDKSILSYADSDSCTLTATVYDDSPSALPMEGVTVTFKKGTVTLGTDTTDANGEATYTYSSAGVGDVSFTAEVGSLVSETYSVQDCRFYDVSSSENVSKYGSSSAFSYDSTEQAYYISTTSVKNITRDSVVGDFDFEISMDIKMTNNQCNFYCGESTSSYECQGHLIGTYSSNYKGMETYYTNSSQSVNGRTRFVGYSFDTNKWYTYKVTRNDNVLTVQVLDGDTVIATATDNNVTGTSNSVAWHLYMVQGNMYWKNIKFKPL